MTPQKQPCVECGALILLATAASTGGKCLPCNRGTRANIEAGRKRDAENRKRRAAKQAALQRIRQKHSPTFRDFLKEEDPLGVVWTFLLEIVHAEPRIEAIDSLAPEARVVYVTELLAGEVHNGGFHQYFSNSSGKHALEALRALQTLDAVEASSLFAKAIDAFPDRHVPHDRVLRNELLDAAQQERPGFFDELDTQYYALVSAIPPREDQIELALSYMRRHPDAHILSRSKA